MIRYLNIIKYLIILLLFISTSIYALVEKNLSAKTDLFLNTYYSKNSTASHFIGLNKIKIATLKINVHGKNGAIVILPGQGEQIIKYNEFMYDLIQKGYGPIFAMNHRGQGRSGRMLKDEKKGYVEDFNDYVADFDKYLTDIIKINSNQKIFLITHSMGAAVSVLWLQQNSRKQGWFNKTVLASPMIKINPTPFPYFLAKLFSSSLCLIESFCKSYAPNKKTFNAYRTFKNNTSTSSFQRWKQTQRQAVTYDKQFINGPTLKWANEAFKIHERINKNLIKISNSVKILIGGSDKSIDRSSQIEVCTKTMLNCSYDIFKNSKHHILMETDLIRDRAINIIDNFFRNK